MAQGCLAALFGIGLRPTDQSPRLGDEPTRDFGVSEGEFHSGVTGYEGGDYTEGYQEGNEDH